jgi:hypothetical protein
MSNSLFTRDIVSIIQGVEEDDYTAFLRNSLEFAGKVSEDSKKKYSLESYERWDLSQDTGILTLTSEKLSDSVKSLIQIVGTFSHSSTSWLWAWGNRHVKDCLCLDAELVHSYGLEHEIPELMTSAFDSTIDEAWDFSAVTLKLGGGVGLYSGDFGEGRIFMVLKTIDIVNVL